MFDSISKIGAYARMFFARRLHRTLGAIGLAVLCGGGFVAISAFNVARLQFAPLRSMSVLWVDASIPFVPGWVWIYLLYYPFCFLPLFLREVRDDAPTFMRTMSAFALQFGISFAFFLLWPLRMVHPQLPLGLNGSILAGLYHFDLGFNSFPSLHLANIVFVSFLFLRRRGRWWGGAVFGVAALITVSTVLVKQHFFSDICAGAFLGWASFMLSERLVFPRACLQEVPAFSDKLSA